MRYLVNRNIDRITILILILIFTIKIANALTLNDSSTNFLNGTFNNTYYFNNSVQLNQTLSGTFTSRILTSNSFYSAINITVNFTNTSENLIILLDSSADLWKSTDEGVSWTLVNDDYNDDTNNQKYMTIDNNRNIYTVEDDDEIWKSTDLGIFFSKINNDYDQSGSSGNPLFIIYANNSIYLIEKDEDIWRSDNSGLNFTKVNGTDFNKNNGDVEGVAVINNKIYLADTDADIWTSDNNGISWLLIKEDYNDDENNNMLSMTSANNSLFIVENDDDVWKSIDLGITWTKTSDDFGGSAEIITSDSLNNVYIIEHNEDIWRSSNEGTSWIEINNTDFNQGSGDVLAGVSVSTVSNFKYQVRYAQNLNNWSEFVGPNNHTNLFFTNFSNILNIQNIKYIQYKTFFWSNSLQISPHLFSTDILIEEDLTPPSINLLSPENLYTDTDGTISFSYNVSDESPVSNCSLLINSQIIQTNNNINNNAQNNFNANISYGLFNWSVKCTDVYNNFNSSSLRAIRVILISIFDGNTTNLTNLNLSNISDFIIENLNYGKIRFLQSVNLENGADINSNINISRYITNLNSSNLSMLNVTAEISMYNVNDTNLTVLMNNQVCPSSICTYVNFSNNIYVFRVTHFTSFSLNASFQVAASNDPSTPSQSSGGGSGGGRRTSISKDAIPKNDEEEKNPEVENSKSSNNEPLDTQEINEEAPEGIKQSPTRFRFPLWAMVSIVVFLVLLTVYEIFIIKRRRNKKEKVIH